MRKQLLILALVLVTTLAGMGQMKMTTESTRAMEKYRSAYQFYTMMAYQFAIRDINEALALDQDFIECYILLAEVNTDMQDFDLAVENYKTVIGKDPAYHPDLYYYLAKAQYRIGEYRDALVNVDHFMRDINIPATLKSLGDRLRENCRFAIHAIENPVPFEPVNLGDSINTAWDEYWPTLTADEGTLIYTVLVPGHPRTGSGRAQEDFYISNRTEGGWSRGREAGSPLNTPRNEGAQSITADGQYMFFTICNKEGGLGRCDIYVSRKTSAGWSAPFNVGAPVNSSSWESQPAISADGRTLYFVSNRPGGKGKMDIWMSSLNPEGYWDNPVNLGDSINTPEDDTSPFIHPDNLTLYFASHGHLGMGESDLFMTTHDGRYNWKIPENLGYPINTHNDEAGLVVNAPGNRAYFSSDRLSDKRKDIYSFDLYSEARPIPVTYMKGTVFDAESKRKLLAKFELIDLETTELVVEAFSDDQGNFLVSIPTDRDYALNVSCSGYLFYSDHFTLVGQFDEMAPFQKDVPLAPIQVGEITILNNIFFEFNSFTLLEESQVELNMVIGFMMKNGSVSIEIGGHTDQVGTEEYNQQLSVNRSKTVFDYLVDNGIPSSRMRFRGYGETRRVDTTDTEAGRARNRRTELKVIGIENP